MSAPVIVIVGRVSPEAKNVRGEAFASGQRYSKAIERAGGVPVMLPPISALDDGRVDDLVSRVDGVLFHGGGDIDPQRYGQRATAEQLYGIVPEHDDIEFAVMRAAIRLDRPVLGLCRGMQVLNVLCGGTLHQDIGTEEHWLRYAPVTIEPGSRLAKGFGTDRPEHCHHVHHQAIDRLGAGLRVVAWTADGMPEGLELESASWVVATQWHPEDNAHDDPVQQSIFDELVRQARS